MRIGQAFEKRKSCRAFLDREVEPNILRSIIAGGSRAPSNGNLQPWQIYVLTGNTLALLKDAARKHVKDQLPMPVPEYHVYPKPFLTLHAMLYNLL